MFHHRPLPCQLDAAVEQISKNNVTGVQYDVSNIADLDRLYATVKEQKGHIDILFANPALANSPLGEISEDRLDIISMDVLVPSIYFLFNADTLSVST
jgi:NAD(P)-dependent dehydrogenase (short-subunit alcohol dehydrogenase family)